MRNQRLQELKIKRSIKLNIDLKIDQSRHNKHSKAHKTKKVNFTGHNAFEGFELVEDLDDLDPNSIRKMLV